MQWPIDRLEGGQSEKGQRHRSYLSPDLSQKIGRRKTLFRFFFLFFFSPLLPFFPSTSWSLRAKKKVFLFSRHPRTHARFRCPMTSSGQPVGSISLLVEDSTVAVLCFAAKGEKRKESRGIWVWDDVMMTEFKKRSIIFSSRTVSLLSFSPRLFVQVRVTLELFCHLPTPVETYPTQQPPRYFCSSVSCSV